MHARQLHGFNLPTVDDYDLVKAAVLEVAALPDATVKAVNDWRLYVQLERDYADLDFLSWPPLTIRFTGFLAIHGRGSEMVLSYRELAQKDETINSSVNHTYIMRKNNHELIEFGHSITAVPQIPEPRQELEPDWMLDMSDEGRRILQRNLSGQLELTEGDCTILFDRLAALVV